MEKFDLSRACVKCGYNKQPASVIYAVGVFDQEDQSNIYRRGFGVTQPDYLIRTCIRCGYRWPERTLDADE